MSIKLPNFEAILSIDSNNGLAKNGKIPWKSKTDMMFFKNKTIDHIVIMGSKTLLSLPKQVPLKDRTNIVVTHQKEKYSKLYHNNNLIFLDLEETLRLIKTDTKNKIFIIGGNDIYNLLLPYCSTIWITKIKQNYDCDLIFNFTSLLETTYTKEIVYEDNELEIMCVKFLPF